MKVEIPNRILVTLSGQTSRGVQGIEVTEDSGHLIFTLTDGSRLDMGSITGPQGEAGKDGADGIIFTPSVSAAGVLSWTNDGGKANPAAVSIKGPKGDTGATGAKGETGATGPKGDTGATGPKGDPGATGPQGPQGDKGEPGEKGETGSGFQILGYYATETALSAAVTRPNAGDAYGVGVSEPYDIYIWDGVNQTWVDNGPLQGAKGEAGKDGAPGADGADGKDGTTFTPSVSAAGVLSWTNDGGKANPAAVSIKGPKGDTGATGAKGETGATGPKGDTGATGPKGDTGATGPAGTTPVKGVDYFTAADKTEIAEDAAALVNLSGKQDKITASGILKGDGSGGVSAAVAGTDYPTVSSVTAKQDKITASGILKGAGSGSVSAATAGSDYISPSNLTTRLNRSNGVNVSNASYTTYMARGIALNSEETTPTVNGTIVFQYE